MKSRKKNQTQSLKSAKNLHKTKKAVKECAEKEIPVDFYDKTILKRILKHLSKQKKKPEENCPVEDSSESRVDNQVKLRCRQLPNVVQELRKAIMKHDWNYVSTLTMILCHPGLKYYTTIILRVCFILLLNHPKSNFSLVQDFIRLTTGYLLDEDVNKFIRILFTLRKTPLTPLESGKYIRKTGDYKVIRDPEFENL